MAMVHNTAAATQEIASVNGVALNTAEDLLSADELRQRACSELLRQAAMTCGLLPESDTPGSDGVLSEAANRPCAFRLW